MPQCYLCPYTHYFLDGLTSHMLKHHGEEVNDTNNNHDPKLTSGIEGHKCLYCRFTHSDPGTTLAHLRDQHAAEVKRRLDCSARFDALEVKREVNLNEDDKDDGMSVDIPLMSKFPLFTLNWVFNLCSLRPTDQV